mgnify:CR=1 FL=1
MVLVPTQGSSEELGECSIAALDGGLRELAIGCHAKGRQIQRGVPYRVTLAIEGLGRVDLNRTVERAPHAQEVLSFLVSPRTLILPAAGQETITPTLTLTLLNRGLYARTSAKWLDQAEPLEGSFKYCLLGGEPSGVVPLHEPAGDRLSYECEVPERWTRPAGPPRELPLAVIDSHGHTVFETTVLLASPPRISSVSPRSIEYHPGASTGASRVQLLTPDSAFFSAFETEAVLLNRSFSIQVSGDEVYFDFEVDSPSLTSQKLQAAELTLRVRETAGLEPKGPLCLGQVASLTVYLLTRPQLLSLSHLVLFTRGAAGEEVSVQARFLPQSGQVEMVLGKV